MNIFTTDIILFLLLISVLNDPLLKMFQNLNLDFITSEILIGLILILILWLIHKLVLRKYILKK